jgi:hypothetical protein
MPQLLHSKPDSRFAVTQMSKSDSRDELSALETTQQIHDLPVYNRDPQLKFVDRNQT